MEAQGRRLVPSRLSAVMREGERVMPLELFFDLVFVLALTQCTTLMVDNPTWEGIAQGVVVLALLWWTWTGYAWLTSVVDPEEGAVRLALLAAMAALLIAALSVPEAFGDSARVRARLRRRPRRAHRAVRPRRAATIPTLRHSVAALAASTGRRRRAADRRRPARRHRAGRALGAGAAARHGRAVLLRRRGLEARRPPTSPSATGWS